LAIRVFSKSSKKTTKTLDPHSTQCMKPVGAKPWADGVKVGAVGPQAGLQERQLGEVHLWRRGEGCWMDLWTKTVIGEKR